MDRVAPIVASKRPQWLRRSSPPRGVMPDNEMGAVRSGGRTQPMRVRSAHQRSAATSDGAVGGAAPRLRVLVVDDDADVAWSLSMVLELSGYDVRTAFDGPSALLIAESFRPDLTTLDIAMPKMSGYEVCRRLRATPEGQKMVIVALTGLGQKSDTRRSLNAGFDLHVIKPVDPCELERLFLDLLPRRAH